MFLISTLVTNMSYLVMWLFLSFVYFKLLKTIKIERLFPQGKITEIRIAYFLLTVILSFVTCEAIFKFINLFQFD